MRTLAAQIESRVNVDIERPLKPLNAVMLILVVIRTKFKSLSLQVYSPCPGLVGLVLVLVPVLAGPVLYKSYSLI